MDNLIASNERTLVIFDSVCNGLAECLALVHIDIKQMTEHRNQLAEIEQERIQAKLLPGQELVVVTNDQHRKSYSAASTETYDKPTIVQSNGKSKKVFSETSLDDDPYQLKLLDKRLADSFSQAISMCEKQKSLIIAKSSSVSSHNGRPSIFQMLLGKSSSMNKGSGTSMASSLARRRFTAPNCSIDRNATGNTSDKLNDKAVDNRVIIDDINKQTRLAMQYSKQLEAHLYKVEELKSKYEMHLKMGLVVRSVSRAYLAGGSTAHRQYSPTDSLNRRHHRSSLLINDSSSLGTHSSMSSLNLSSWSFSRNKASKDRRESVSSDKRNRLDSSQRFISTISLNNQKNHKQRLSLAKLISSPTKDSQQQQEGYTTHYVDSCAKLRGHGSPVSASTTDSPPSSGSLNNPTYLYEAWHTNELDSNLNVGGCRQALALDNDNLNNNCSKHNSVDLSTRSHSPLKRNLLKASSKQQQVAPLQHQVPNKTTIREFIDNIDKIESELESYMGSFLLVVEDIQGFARVCQGDVFEIIIKYGDAQKFKTRISVLKDNRQKCDNRQTVFKARIADVLAIKAYECKGLGKKVLLGHKLFETRDLFTARSQLMTISLNQTGTIKLNLIITWNPLHMAPNNSPMSIPSLDISHISLPPTPISSSTLSSVSSVPSINGTTTMINIQAHHKSKASNSPLSLDKQRARHHQSHRRAEPQNHHELESDRGYHIPPPDYITNEADY